MYTTETRRSTSTGRGFESSPVSMWCLQQNRAHEGGGGGGGDASAKIEPGHFASLRKRSIFGNYNAFELCMI